jgi:hypothetical protein
VRRPLTLLTALAITSTSMFVATPADAQFRFPYPYPVVYDDTSSIRIQVKPSQTEVFVDGYYAGTVDDFDGVFQRLHVPPGEHEITLYLEGHRAERRKLYLGRRSTHSLRHDMVALAAGDVADPRPEPVEPPPQPPLPPPGAPGRRFPRAQPLPAPAATRFGTLSIRVLPADAEIVIDGERWEGPGDQERLIVQVAEGRHRIEVAKEGYNRYSSDVELRAGETEQINISLLRR